MPRSFLSLPLLLATACGPTPDPGPQLTDAAPSADPAAPDAHVRPDEDGHELRPGDWLLGLLAPAGDTDSYRFIAPAGRFVITATPPAAVDVELELRDAVGDPLGTWNTGGAGTIERAYTGPALPTTISVIVRHVGGAPGLYSLRVQPAEDR